MRVRVMPVETGRIFKRRVAGLKGGAEHLVLIASGRKLEAMEVEVRGGSRHAASAASGGVHEYARRGQFVLES